MIRSPKKAIRSFIRGVGMLLMSLLCHYSFGQTAKLDSLRQQTLNYQQRDSLQVDLWNQLSWEIHTVSLDSAAIYAHKAREMAVQLDYPLGLARAYNLLGVVAALKGHSDAQEKWNDLALIQAEACQDSFVLSVIYNDLANIYALKNEHAKALAFYQNALRYLVVDDEVGEVFTTGNIALLYSELGDEQMAQTYWGRVMRKIDETQDPYVKVVALMSKASYYWQEGAADSVRAAIEEALIISVENENYLKEVDCLEWLSELDRKDGKLELALQQLERAAEIAAEKGLHSRDLSITFLLVEWHMSSHDYDQARVYLESIRKRGHLDRASDLQTLMGYYELSARLWGLQGEYKKAYDDQIMLVVVRDSLQQLRQLQHMAELEVQYEVERQKVEYELMKAEKKDEEVRVKYHKTMNRALSAILVLALVIGVLVWLSARQKQRYAEQLREEVAKKTTDLRLKNEELEGFTHIVSHDLKEPLRNMISFVNLIERRGDELDATERGIYFGFIKKGANQLYNLVEDVLQFSKFRKTTPKIAMVDTAKVIGEVKDALQLKVQEKEAIICVPELPTIESSEAILFLIFKNLIENGITYNRSNPPVVEIKYQDRNGQHEFTIRDNGMGIPIEFREKVFKMFFRLHNRNEFEGTGLGLAIVKKLTEQLKGSIHFESNAAGTTFFLKIPRENEALTV